MKSLRIAVHNPAHLSLIKSNLTLYAYVIEFIRKYRPLIYLSRPRKPLRYWFWTVPTFDPDTLIEKLKGYGIEYERSMVITDVDELNRRVDALLCFNGDIFMNPPEAGFKGLKIYHTQDYMTYPSLNYRALRKGGVDYLFGVSQLDEHSSFFRANYPAYVGKLLSIPYGYADRFKVTVPFKKREEKILATGSINPMSITKYPTGDTLVTAGNTIVHKRASPFTRLKFFVYYHFLIRECTREMERAYPRELWAHPFRRLLFETAEQHKDILVNQLPGYPQVKKYDFDLVAELNKYTFFVVDDGFLDIIGGKAYEGIAAGGVMLCPDLPTYDEFGFVDGKTCIKYRPMDVEDMCAKARWYLAHPEKLRRIQAAGYALVTRNYSHPKIAEMIYRKTKKAYAVWSTSSR